MSHHNKNHEKKHGHEQNEKHGHHKEGHHGHEQKQGEQKKHGWCPAHNSPKAKCNCE